jgi:tartrate dehydratase beta subunit/fumarate hydratase class I family protein
MKKIKIGDLIWFRDCGMRYLWGDDTTKLGIIVDMDTDGKFYIAIGNKRLTVAREDIRVV